MTSAIAMAGTALSGTEPGALAASSREFYLLRKYSLRTGPQIALVQEYFQRALIPALNRKAITPVGAFKLDIGPETPTFYVLVPSSSVETLATLDSLLMEDPEFVKASSAFREAPAAAPAFVRIESMLLSAFAGWPKLAPPKNARRIFQLRTYESPSYAGHLRKIQMFNEGEIGVFTRTGLSPVFFGDTLVGPSLPNLTYMLTFADVAELNDKWKIFVSDPEWKELSHRPQYSDVELVSNISNLYLSPLDCSQI